MNAIESFFRDHNAVPADDDGPRWDLTPTHALHRWAKDDCRLWDTIPEVREQIRGRMVDIASEGLRRFNQWDHKTSTATEAALGLDAYHRICSRIGYDCIEK